CASSSAPCALAIARGDGPIGFSFEASLTALVMPSSRSSSSIGLPGVYASTASRCGRGMRTKTLLRDRIAAERLHVAARGAQLFDRTQDRPIGDVPVDLDQDQIA